MLNLKQAFPGISANNFKEVKKFYTEILGLELVSESMGVELKLPGGGKLFIYEKTDHTPATFTVLNLVVSDIDKAVDELNSKGVAMERYNDMPFEQDEKGIARAEAPEDGPTIAWFKDPAANVLSLIQE